MRYSKEQKAEVVAFVEKYNAEKGRGGQSAAAEKFKISPISVANWLKSAGVELPGKGGRKKVAKGGAGKPGPKRKGGRRKGAAKKKAARSAPAPASASASSASVGDKLARLNEIHAQIQSLQAEFDQIKSSL